MRELNLRNCDAISTTSTNKFWNYGNYSLNNIYGGQDNYFKNVLKWNVETLYYRIDFDKKITSAYRKFLSTEIYK